MKSNYLLMVVAVSIFSCTEEDPGLKAFVDDESIQSINGTWKVESYEDFQTGTIEYQTRENSLGYDIILTFDDTGSPKLFSGQITSNSVAGHFDYTGVRRLKILEYSSTYVDQPDWGNKFTAAISNAEATFMVNTQRLRILYDGDTKSITFRKQH